MVLRADNRNLRCELRAANRTTQMLTRSGERKGEQIGVLITCHHTENMYLLNCPKAKMNESLQLYERLNRQIQHQNDCATESPGGDKVHVSL